MAPKDDILEDLARRLRAAFTSWKKGNKSVDSELRRYADEPLGRWIDVAKSVNDLHEKAMSELGPDR
jgi:hypothetical protein